jgi:hypothetical protein
LCATPISLILVTCFANLITFYLITLINFDESTDYEGLIVRPK